MLRLMKFVFYISSYQLLQCVLLFLRLYGKLIDVWPDRLNRISYYAWYFHFYQPPNAINQYPNQRSQSCAIGSLSFYGLHPFDNITHALFMFLQELFCSEPFPARATLPADYFVIHYFPSDNPNNLSSTA